MRKIKLTRGQKIGVRGLCLLLFSIMFASLILPKMTYYMLRWKVAIKLGWQMRYVWGKLPFSMDFRFYMFNLTNPDEVNDGAKPIMHEVGPYVYTEYADKIFQEDHLEDDTLSYNPRSFFYFDAEKSAPLTGDEEIIIPSYFGLGIMNVVARERPTATPIVGRAVDSILRKPKNLFTTEKVRKILFDGMRLDCTVTDFAGAAVCNQLKDQYKDYGLTMLADNQYLLSLFNARNGTFSTRMRVRRGVKDVKQVCELVEYDGKSNMSVWEDDYCDKFRGTEASLFPPFLNSKGKDDLEVVYSSLCRSFTLRSDGFGEWHGLRTIRYTTDLGTDGKNLPEDRCYCMDPMDSETCLRKGAYDAYKCIRLPIIFTNPHFYMADPRYREQVSGLNPDKEKHMISIEIDPFTGIPLHAFTRAQFNMKIMKIEKFRLMKNFPDGLLPLFWIDQEMQLPYFLTDEIQFYHKAHVFGLIIQYLVMLSGFGLCGYAGYKMYKEYRENKMELQTTIPVKPVSEPSSADKKMNISALQPAVLPTSLD